MQGLESYLLALATVWPEGEMDIFILWLRRCVVEEELKRCNHQIHIFLNRVALREFPEATEPYHDDMKTLEELNFIEDHQSPNASPEAREDWLELEVYSMSIKDIVFGRSEKDSTTIIRESRGNVRDFIWPIQRTLVFSNE